MDSKKVGQNIYSSCTLKTGGTEGEREERKVQNGDSHTNGGGTQLKIEK